MEIDFERLEAALAGPKDKSARKYLTQTAEELRREEPKRCTERLKAKYSHEPCRSLAKRCRIAKTLCIAALAAAAAVIITAYLLGDFGAAVMTAWVQRYKLSAAVLVAMGILVLAGLHYGTARDRLLAAALLEEHSIAEERDSTV